MKRTLIRAWNPGRDGTFPPLMEKEGTTWGARGMTCAQPAMLWLFFFFFFSLTHRLKWRPPAREAEVQNCDPQLTPLPWGDLWEQKGFSMYASAFEEIPLTRLEKLTSDSRDCVCPKTPSLPDLSTCPQCQSVYFVGGGRCSVEFGVICLADSHLRCRQRTAKHARVLRLCQTTLSVGYWPGKQPPSH